MGPFLADRVFGGSAYWLCGVAIAASAFSLATLPDQGTAQPAPVWKQGGCKKLARADDRRVLSVGPMLEAGSYRDIMRETVRAELTDHSPWRIELTEAPSGGFYVDGTVDEMKVEHDGKTTRVYCELKLWVRSADRTTSLLSGSAAVDTTRGPRDIALSRQACVSTVAEARRAPARRRSVGVKRFALVALVACGSDRPAPIAPITPPTVPVAVPDDAEPPLTPEQQLAADVARVQAEIIALAQGARDVATAANDATSDAERSSVRRGVEQLRPQVSELRAKLDAIQTRARQLSTRIDVADDHVTLDDALTTLDEATIRLGIDQAEADHEARGKTKKP